MTPSELTEKIAALDDNTKRLIRLDFQMVGDGGAGVLPLWLDGGLLRTEDTPEEFDYGPVGDAQDRFPGEDEAVFELVRLGFVETETESSDSPFDYSQHIVDAFWTSGAIRRYLWHVCGCSLETTPEAALAAR